jgi:hypothetical protein
LSWLSNNGQRWILGRDGLKRCTITSRLRERNYFDVALAVTGWWRRRFQRDDNRKLKRSASRTLWAQILRSARPDWVKAVEKVLSEPLERNNRIRTAICLDRNCVLGSDFESMLRVRTRKIVFQQY